ncbi:MAG: DNA-3-methyladenine glycosylase 2 family protein [candidate division Zixibacteria bacterium]|nr:DNA-3-methyladenine glycosylase 2 family protein [candidate division Zixibacteria bacterium]
MAPSAPFDFSHSLSFVGERSKLPFGSSLSLVQFPHKKSESDRALALAHVSALRVVTRIEGVALRLYIFAKSIQNGTHKESDRPDEAPVELTVEWAATEYISGHSEFETRVPTLVESFVRRLLSLDLDLSPFYESLKKDKLLSAILSNAQGLRPTLTPCVFDSAVLGVLSQQITLSFGVSLYQRVTEIYSESIEAGGEIWRFGPDPSRLANSSEEKLRELQVSQNKARTLIGLAQEIESGDLNLESMETQSYDMAIDRLTQVKGIGPWTANYILMRGVGHSDGFPLGDIGLQKALQNLLSLDKRPGNSQMTQIAEPFRPYRSLFTLYLWNSLN